MNRLRLLLLSVLPVLIFAVTAVALQLPGREAVSAGAAAWERGDVAAARAAWSEAAIDGVASSVVHYDLGNAWFREGDLPRAIAHWRAAALQDPRDGRVAHNLALARSRLTGVPDAADPPAAWLAFASLPEVGALAIVLLVGFSIATWRWRRAEGALPMVVLGVLGLVVGGAAIQASRELARAPIGVVVDAPAVVRDIASPEGRPRATLPPGTEVRVDRELGDFVLVSTPEGRRGWVPAAALLRVGPGSVVTG